MAIEDNPDAGQRPNPKRTPIAAGTGMEEAEIQQNLGEIPTVSPIRVRCSRPRPRRAARASASRPRPGEAPGKPRRKT